MSNSQLIFMSPKFRGKMGTAGTDLEVNQL